MLTTKGAMVQLDTHDNRIAEALAGIRYGSIEIIIHDGRIVQIERREKHRFELDAKRNGEHLP